MVDLETRLQNALNETRMLMLGAQVLVGFQFNAVFQRRFEHLPRSSQFADVACLALLLVAFALLIVPVPYHRIVERGKISTRFQHFVTAVAAPALVPFAIVMGIDLLIASRMLFTTPVAIAAGATLVVVAMFFWVGLELLKRPKQRESKDEEQMPPLDKRIQNVLTEARVVLPGTQALLGFAFAACLTEGFSKLPRTSQSMHLVAVALVAIAIILLMTPAAYHRLVYQGNDSEEFHAFATRIILISLIPFALGLSIDFYVVALKVTESATFAATAAAALLVLFYGLWFGYTTWRARSLRA